MLPLLPSLKTFHESPLQTGRSSRFLKAWHHEAFHNLPSLRWQHSRPISPLELFVFQQYWSTLYFPISLPSWSMLIYFPFLASHFPVSFPSISLPQCLSWYPLFLACMYVCFSRVLSWALLYYLSWVIYLIYSSEVDCHLYIHLFKPFISKWMLHRHSNLSVSDTAVWSIQHSFLFLP